MVFDATATRFPLPALAECGPVHWQAGEVAFQESGEEPANLMLSRAISPAWVLRCTYHAAVARAKNGCLTLDTST